MIFKYDQTVVDTLQSKVATHEVLNASEQSILGSILAEYIAAPTSRAVVSKIGEELRGELSAGTAHEILRAVVGEFYAPDFHDAFCGECHAVAVVADDDNVCMLCGETVKNKFMVTFSFTLHEIEATDEYDAETEARETLYGMSLFDLDIELESVEEETR